jgi:hypothetical protein
VKKKGRGYQAVTPRNTITAVSNPAERTISPILTTRGSGFLLAVRMINRVVRMIDKIGIKTAKKVDGFI